MELHLTPDQEAFIRQGIEAGRYHAKEDAVQEAMSLWEERERRRLEILAAVEQAEASLARGEGRRITTHEALPGSRSDPPARSRVSVGTRHAALHDTAATVRYRAATVRERSLLSRHRPFQQPFLRVHGALVTRGCSPRIRAIALHLPALDCVRQIDGQYLIAYVPD